MIFPNIFTEEILQIKDKTRLDSTGSFRLDMAPTITDILIEPEAGAGFTSVFNGGDSRKWLMDWAYITNGAKIVTVKIIDENAAEYTESDTIMVLSEEDDHLYSNDSELVAIEHDIRKYIPKGRNTWKDKHRLAQTFIVDHLNDDGITNTSGDRLDKYAIVDIEEVNEWSKYRTLFYIYEDIKVNAEDVSNEKAQKYKLMAENSAEKAFIRLDTSGDGEEDTKVASIVTRLRVR